MIWSGPGSLPGGSSSSPVAMMATSGRRTTRQRRRGWRRRPATAPRHRARVPARAAISPCVKSSPARADVAAGGDRLDHLDVAVAERRAFSWMRMVSAPSGTGAPVKMRTASPAPTVPAKRRAGRRLADDRKPSPAGRDVGGAHGVAVHGRGGEGRLRAQRHRPVRPARGRPPRPAPRFRRRPARRRRAAARSASSTGKQRHRHQPRPRRGSRRTCRRSFRPAGCRRSTMPRSTALAMS